MNIRKTVIVGATAATLGLAGWAGMAGAATSATETSLVDKIATKFNLNRDEVQAVFDQNHQERHARMQEEMEARLKQAVTDGKLTQAQSDHITNSLKEIHDLKGNGGPGSVDEATRAQMREKMEALRTWAEQNNVELSLVGPHGKGFRGHGGPGFGPPPVN